MFKAARIMKIKEIIANRTQVDVQTLSDILGVSNVTIRSDLEQLEQDGFIYRTHGGAILRETAVPVPPVTVGVGTTLHFQFSDDVIQIARVAADYIEENEWFFLGGGNTCCAIAKALCDKSVRVVTNNVLASLALAENPKAQVMLVGGRLLNDAFPYLSGDLAANNIESMYFQKVIYGVSGIDFKCGYSVVSADEYNLFQRLRAHANEMIIAADASKCNKTSFQSLGPLTSVNTLISSGNFPEEYKNYFYENNIKLFLGYDILASSVGGGDSL